MGGSSSKSVTTGYKFFAGMHMVLCWGTVDTIRKIVIEDKHTLIEGSYSHGIHDVHKPNLFGGDGSQGGIEGKIEVLDGRADQEISQYLKQSQAETKGGKLLLPAYRGVASLVLFGDSSKSLPLFGGVNLNIKLGKIRGMYFGNNPYLKTWKTLVQRIGKKTDGSEQWQPDLAKIPSYSPAPSNIYILIAMDCSGSMATGNRLLNVKAQVKELLKMYFRYGVGSESTVNIAVTGWSSTSTTRMYKNASESDLQALLDFVDGLTAIGQTYFNEAFSAVNSFFTKTTPASEVEQVMLFITDGQPSSNSADTARAQYLDLITQKGDWANSPVRITGFNVDYAETRETAKVTNNGVRVIDGEDPQALTKAASQGFMFKYWDMNPSHIIRECLTDEYWGKGLRDSDLDESSFVYAAEVLSDESLGLSIIWGMESSIDEFIDNILKHIDGVLFDDPETGKISLKLIRNDYEFNDLPVIDHSNIVEVRDFSRPVFSELVNQVVVNFTNMTDNDKNSFTVVHEALYQMQGEVNSITVKYTGATNMNVANRLGTRELKTASTPLAKVEVTVFKSVGKKLRIGDCVRLTLQDYQVNDVAFRITGIGFGTGISNGITLNLVEDHFATPDEGLVTITPSTSVTKPRLNNINNLIGMELPYYLAVAQFGEAAVKGALEALPETAYFMAVMARNQLGLRATNGQLWTRDTAIAQRQLELADIVDFAPFFTLQSNMDERINTITTSLYFDLEVLDSSRLPLLGMIGGKELVSLDKIEVIDGDTPQLLLTITRGVLDSQVVAHSIGEDFLVFGQYWGFDPQAYVMGTEIEYAAVPTSMGEVADLSSTPKHYFELNARAIRPYPPQNVKFDDQYFPTEFKGGFTLSWATRNRLQQTAGTFVSWYDGNVAPEAGVTYTVRAKLNSVPVLDIQGLTTPSLYISDEELGEGTVEISISSYRDGFECYVPFTHTFYHISNAIRLEITKVTPINISGVSNADAEIEVIIDNEFGARVNLDGSGVTGYAPPNAEITVEIEEEDL